MFFIILHRRKSKFELCVLGSLFVAQIQRFSTMKFDLILQCLRLIFNINFAESKRRICLKQLGVNNLLALNLFMCFLFYLILINDCRQLEQLITWKRFLIVYSIQISFGHILKIIKHCIQYFFFPNQKQRNGIFLIKRRYWSIQIIPHLQNIFTKKWKTPRNYILEIG